MEISLASGDNARPQVHPAVGKCIIENVEMVQGTDYKMKCILCDARKKDIKEMYEHMVDEHEDEVFEIDEEMQRNINQEEGVVDFMEGVVITPQDDGDDTDEEDTVPGTVSTFAAGDAAGMTGTVAAAAKDGSIPDPPGILKRQRRQRRGRGGIGAAAKPGPKPQAPGGADGGANTNNEGSKGGGATVRFE